MFTGSSSQRDVDLQFIESWLSAADQNKCMNIDSPESKKRILREIQATREGAEKRIKRLEALLNNPKYFK